MSSPPPPDGPRFQPGQASPPGHDREYPPTAAFPPAAPPQQQPEADYGPPGHAPQGYPPPGHAPHGYPPQGYAQEPGAGYPPPQGHPQGYPPPGYPPGPPQGYPPGPPPGYQPGYQPGPPPGRPPRRSSVPLVAVIIAVTLLLCGGVATAGVLIYRNVADRAKDAVDSLPTAVPAPELPGLPTDLPTGVPGVPGVGRDITVTYEITGDGPARILYQARSGEAPTRLDDVKLPWKIDTTMQTPALVSVVGMRMEASDGSITCRALVDGKEVRKNESRSGYFATAACTNVTLD